MKKFFLAVILILTIFSTPARNCEATDIWVESWSAEKVDIYIIEETIKNISAENTRAFSVSIKKVQGEKLLQTVSYTFSKFEDGFWRYESSKMDGEHLTVVIPRNRIFEFCMENLGWSYQIEDFWYY